MNLVIVLAYGFCCCGASWLGSWRVHAGSNCWYLAAPGEALLLCKAGGLEVATFLLARVAYR